METQVILVAIINSDLNAGRRAEPDALAEAEARERASSRELAVFAAGAGALEIQVPAAGPGRLSNAKLMEGLAAETGGGAATRFRGGELAEGGAEFVGAEGAHKRAGRAGGQGARRDAPTVGPQPRDQVLCL